MTGQFYPTISTKVFQKTVSFCPIRLDNSLSTGISRRLLRKGLFTLSNCIRIVFTSSGIDQCNAHDLVRNFMLFSLEKKDQSI